MRAFYRLSKFLCGVCCVALVACSEASSVDAEDAGDQDVDVRPPRCTDMDQMEFQTDYMLQWSLLKHADKSPYCVRDDGFGGTSRHCGSSEPIEEYYYHCKDPIISTSDGTQLNRQPPCTWWPLLGEDDEGNCFHDFACVPRDRLHEIGWPEGSDLDFYDGCPEENNNPGLGPQPPSEG
ncbi:hypothetical protein EA187_10525 [Lujinxingia sediminis]|uniref:Lipoprotein n=1 Tax=Lujinxingia sediminis TaxID=2480984 RepID=A0ABY0CT37_9DELT|nr:hypothetical protein [Lujinxingia sediminis]RVU43991.1 hypothetical protein EA187_10525 [Lujinxingia sediminis]